MDDVFANLQPLGWARIAWTQILCPRRRVPTLGWIAALWLLASGAAPPAAAQSSSGFDAYSLMEAPLAPPLAPALTAPSVAVPGHTPSLWLGSSEGIQSWPSGGYGWEPLPQDTIYPFYLGDVKASRLSAIWSGGDEELTDTTLGGRFGFMRFNDGQEGPFRRGMQLDIEASANLRLAPTENMDVRSVDFRAGLPLSFGFGRFHTRVGYYHLSSHLGDEFLLKNPSFERLNFSRDVLYVGAGYWLTQDTRIYGESGWAFYNDISEEWEFMFGMERAPRLGTGLRGSPFYAVHVHLREEVDFSGHFSGQIGWAWRRDQHSGLLRVGLNYFNGKSPQYSFFQQQEEQLGLAMWYDF